MGVDGLRYAMTTFPRERDPHLLCMRLGGPQGRSEDVPKISSLPGLDPRTIQHAQSRYIDYAIPARSF